MESDSLSFVQQSGDWGFQFGPFSDSIIIMLVIVVLLILLSALINSAEVAYSSLNAVNKTSLKKKNKINRLVLNHFENPDKLFATIVFTKNTVNLGIVIVAANITNEMIVWQNMPVLKLVIQVFTIAVFVFVFTEFLPKNFAPNYATGIARFMAYPLFLLEKLFRPANGVLIASTNFIKQKTQNHRKNISMEDISQALKLAENQEMSEDKTILEGIVKFGNKSVSEIMKQRVDVVSIDIKSGFTIVLDVIIESGFSRIPVFAGSFDNIKGILYIKDILPHNHKGESFNWQTLVRPPFFVPETKKINALLEEFQKNKVHLAVVIDEYGGTSGIVTLEDVLEEIVGEIIDESDEEDNFYTKISDNVFMFDGKTVLADFFKITRCDENIFEEVIGSAETLAGLILELKGDIPAIHEKIQYQQFSFIIEAVDNRRIKKIKIEINRKSAEPG